jgi:plasmid stabilization system protein ParE
MFKQIVFHPDVAEDIKGAYLWYEKQLQGLGDRFLLELEDGYSAIINFPNSWANSQYGFKRYILNKFPFSIIYKIINNQIMIISVMHNSRKPNYWQDRVEL